MNLRDLEYLLALADLKHFGKAAHACYVSQPTLSGQIKKLEEELEVPLLEGNRRKVQFTIEGLEIIQKARKVIEEAQGLEQLAQSFKDPENGKLRLGIFPTLSPYLLPHIVQSLHSAFPKLELLLVEDQTPRIEKQLLDGDLDVLILALPITHPDLEVLPLFSEPFFLAVSNEHPWADKESVSMNDLGGQKLLLLEDGHCLRDQAMDVCFETGASEQSDFRASSLETLRQMVAIGNGVTLLPELAVQNDLSGHQLKYIPFEEPKPGRGLGLIWRKSNHRQALFHKMGELIATEARKLLPNQKVWVKNPED